MKTFSSLYILIPLAISILFFSCKPDPPIDDPTGFPDQIDAIVSENCATSGCHVGTAPPVGLNLESWENMFKGSEYGSVVVPYSHDWSHLFQHLNTFDNQGPKASPVMPPNGVDPLPESDVIAVKDWIESGAKSKEGTYRWADQRASTGGKLFTLCAGSDLIAVADLKTNLLMEFIEIGQNPGVLEAPHFIVLSPDKKYIYITFISSGVSGQAASAIVEKYKTDTYEFVGRVNVDPDPALLQVNQAGTRAILTHYNNTSETKLTLIDVENMVVLDKAAGNGLLDKPHGLAINSDLSIAYVAAGLGNYYSVWQIKNDKFFDFEKYVLDPSIGGAGPSSLYKPYQVILVEGKNRIYISNNETNDVRVFDTQTNTLIEKIAVGAFPRLMTYDPVDELLFVACANEENFPAQGSAKGCVSVIDTKTDQEVKRIFGLGQRPHGLSVDTQTRKLYVSSENNGGEDPPHHVIDGATGPPGKFKVVDINTLEIIADAETEIAVYPNACVVSE